MGPALQTLAPSIGPIPRVLLPDTDLDDHGAALIEPASGEMPSPAERGERYQLFGEIARGGMGAVLKGRDADLGRDLAVKVLLEEHQGKPELARRFVEEAQIGGQLQHPGIVPVYELGTFGDRRPYFTMKRVKGRTLAALLSARHDPRDELPRFLGIFEQVAQTVAYAHARGVIHRDLKPSNVMVGSFGEVQVMDWGLAKVLNEGGVADEERREEPAKVEVSEIRTVRSGSSEDESQAGSVLGTPAYMAPEQAGGDVELVDRRADVFGLGSILCEILTGMPAYTGANNNEVFRRALRGDTGDARTRLEACGADADLLALAGDCLASEPADRPRDAGVVASRIRAYLTGVQEKLRAAERERAVAEARAEEERRRRRLQVGLAVAVLALTTVGGLSTAYYLQQKQARAAVVARTLGEATTLRDQARAHAADPARWRAALAAIRRVEDALGGGTSRGIDTQARREAEALQVEVQAGLDQSRRDLQLLERLLDIRTARLDDPSGKELDAAYASAFKQAGIDVAVLPPATAGEEIKARPPATALALAVALDEWADVRRRKRNDQAGAKRLSQAASVADPDTWRRELRAALDETDKTTRLTKLQAAARSGRLEERGAVSLGLLGKALDSAGDPAAAEAVLRVAQKRHPGDLWVNYDLAAVCEKRNQREAAIRFYTAARAIRPETAHALAHLLVKKGDSDEAVAVFQDLVRRRAGNGKHLGCLGVLLSKLGRAREAGPVLDAAVAASREAIRVSPDTADLHCNLGLILCDGKHDYAGAIAEFREAIRLDPHDAVYHFNLGIALSKQGKPDEAIAEYREAIRLDPDWSSPRDNLGALLSRQGALAGGHINRGNALKNEGKLDEAIAEYREAIRLKPDDAQSFCELAHALRRAGRMDEAAAAARAAIRLNPDYFWGHQLLAWALLGKEDWDGAAAGYREALRLKPDSSAAHRELGEALRRKGDPDAAIAEYRELVRLTPNDGVAHFTLGNALKAQGKLDAAIAEYREVIRLTPNDARAHYTLGLALDAQGKRDLAIDELREATRLNPGDANTHGDLGWVLLKLGRWDESIAASRAALRLDANIAYAHNNLGIALRQQGKTDEAVVEYQESIRLRPDHAGTHNNLGLALRDQGKLDEAIAQFREAIRITPGDARAHTELGLTLSRQGKLDEANAEYREAIRLKPDFALPHNTLGNALKAQGKLAEAIAEYREAIRIDPRFATAYNNLGGALRAQGNLEDGLAAFRQAGELAKPGSPESRTAPVNIRQTEQMIAVAGRLPAILNGEDRPRDAAELEVFVQLCKDHGRHAAAAGLLRDALAADPALGDDRRNSRRYNAACYAALAGCGKSKDDPPLDEPARAALRQESLGWLKAERDAWARQLEAGAPPDRAVVIKNLKHWQQDADLAGVRGDEALAKLPDDEQKAWRDLWADVDGLLEKAEADRP
jgi:serine/threonine-protein kinase